MGKITSRRLRAGQSGAALLVVMLLLIVITLLGIASMRGAIMQQRMATNTMTRAMAFQVAEAGLRQAEIMVRDGAITFPASGCAAGRCARLDPGGDDMEPWADNRFWTSGNGFELGQPVALGPQVSVRPRFVIEDYGVVSNVSAGGSDAIDLGKAPPATGATQDVYRITSYAATPNGAEVILQSLYRR